jgi:hypothetical protein
MKEEIGMRRLYMKRLRARSSRGFGRLVKKGCGYGNLHRGPFAAENLKSGGRFIYCGL